jgi:hypothetical protein
MPPPFEKAMPLPFEKAMPHPFEKAWPPHLNEKAHLLIAISVNTTFPFAYNFAMTLVSSSSGFSIPRISQSYSSHARLKLSTFFDGWFQSII